MNFSFPLRLVGDVLQLTGFLSYCGPFNQSYRDKLLKDWQAELLNDKIPFSENLNIISALVDPPTVRIASIRFDFTSKLVTDKLHLSFPVRL